VLALGWFQARWGSNCKGGSLRPSRSVSGVAERGWVALGPAWGGSIIWLLFGWFEARPSSRDPRRVRFLARGRLVLALGWFQARWGSNKGGSLRPSTGQFRESLRGVGWLSGRPGGGIIWLFFVCLRLVRVAGTREGFVSSLVAGLCLLWVGSRPAGGHRGRPKIGFRLGLFWAVSGSRAGLGGYTLVVFWLFEARPGSRAPRRVRFLARGRFVLALGWFQARWGSNKGPKISLRSPKRSRFLGWGRGQGSRWEDCVGAVLSLFEARSGSRAPRRVRFLARGRFVLALGWFQARWGSNCKGGSLRPSRSVSGVAERGWVALGPAWG